MFGGIIMKCPNCGSENVNLIYNTSKRGFKGSDACCGYMIFGPLGILCGTFGSGKWSKKEFWLCNNCGSRFSNNKIVKYNKKEQANSYTNNQPIEKAYIEPEKIDEVQKPALPENSVYNENLCAPKTVFNRTEPYSGGLSVESLLKRAELFLEDSEWEKAYEYSENAIDIDACCAEAYLFKFMAEYNISTEDSIPTECACMIEQIDSLTELENYKKAHRFGNDEMKLKLENYSNQAIYNYAAELETTARFSYEYMNAAGVFERISGYSDSSEHIERCKEKYNEFEYFNAYEMLLKATSDEEVDAAKTAFIMLGDYKDSKEKVKSCNEKKSELRYDAACAMLDTAQSVTNIKNAQSMFKKLGNYKDSAEKAAECDKKYSDFNYSEACKILKNAKTVRKINTAVELFNQVQGYDDINERLNECETKRSEIIDTNKKRLKMALICAGVLALIIIIIIVVSSVINRKDKETAENVADIVSETESEITTVSTTDETEKITTAKVSETSATSETTEVEVIESGLKNSEERKNFKFDGGNIECVEYKYYVLNEYESTTEYINFSVQIKLDDYPDSKKAINDALNEIGNAPTAEVLMTSKAPENVGWGMMSEHNQISSVYAENNLLFVTTYYLWDGGGGTSLSLIGYDTTYIFDIRTGKQLKCEQIFKNFNAVKETVVQYADEYIKENIPYEVYSQEPYFEQLVDYEWYNGSWKYDGENFTVLYMYLFQGYVYKNIYVDIPADVIRSYFASESERAENSRTTKLADIVGPGLYPQYAPAPNIEVNAVLADISQIDYRILIHDLEHCVDMCKSIRGNNESSFYDNRRLLGTDDSNIDLIYYYATNYNNADELFDDARNCFSESFISTKILIDKMFEGDFPAFLSVDGQVAWVFLPPSPSGKYDFDNSGVVMYNGTEAEVWVAESSSLEATFEVKVFKMIRHDTNDNWKIDSVKRSGYYADFDNMQEVDFDMV